MLQEVKEYKPEYALREDTEWSNAWYEKAQDTEVKRVLIIGDSMLRQVRSTFQLMLPDIAVDYFGTSATYDCDLFYKQLNNFWEYDYDIIILGMSGHRVLETKLSTSENNRKTYNDSILTLLDYVKEKCKNIVMVNNTPFVNAKKLNKFNEEHNLELRYRNDISSKIAKENNIPYFDFYNYSISKPKVFKYSDYAHFKRQSDIYVVNEILAKMLDLPLNDDIKSIIEKGCEKSQKAVKESEKCSILNKIFSIKKSDDHIKFMIFGFIKIKYNLNR